MHILSSFLTRQIDSLSLSLQKYLLWLSLGLTTIVFVLLHSLLLCYQSNNSRTATLVLQYCMWRNKHKFS